VAYRLDSIPFTPKHDPVHHLIDAEPGADIDFVMVNGDVTLCDGRFTLATEARLRSEAQTEIDHFTVQCAASEASVAPARAAMDTLMDALYWRTLPAEIPADTYPAHLLSG
jgi:5-methylthioadenosine/S-adenosylhomocysteine deaminase